MQKGGQINYPPGTKKNPRPTTHLEVHNNQLKKVKVSGDIKPMHQPM